MKDTLETDSPIDYSFERSQLRSIIRAGNEAAKLARRALVSASISFTLFLIYIEWWQRREILFVALFLLFLTVKVLILHIFASRPLTRHRKEEAEAAREESSHGPTLPGKLGVRTRHGTGKTN